MLNIKKKTEGFTIIEVLIVLAIAGLILLIVFLAVPALQRNSRNTQRANDVSRSLGAAQEVLNNNNGNLATLTSASLRTAIGSPAYYVPANITVAAMPAATASPNGLNATTIDTMVMYTAATCDPAAAQAGKAISGTVRQLAVVWTNEAAVLRCQNS